MGPHDLEFVTDRPTQAEVYLYPQLKKRLAELTNSTNQTAKRPQGPASPPNTYTQGA